MGLKILDVRGIEGKPARIAEIRAMAGRAMLDGPHDYVTEYLEGPLLDLAVANIVGKPAVIHKVDNAISPFYECCVLNETGRLQYQYMPSRCWSQGGPLIEEYKISITNRHLEWAADLKAEMLAVGPDPLIAAMRALVLANNGTVVRM